MGGDFRADRIGSAWRGENPTVLRRVGGGFVMIGEVQFLPGYALLLTDDPGVQRLSDLPRVRRRGFLEDMDALAEAVERACGRMDSGFRRVNVEILGNSEPYLHVHVWPRYDWEPANLVRGPVWLYPAENWSDPRYALGPQHELIRGLILEELDRIRG
ncbi:diadenosine tetraphosphate hydrolase [Nocardia yunnanensis]|uniref:Diadenosine tetraphosphate hydrolase n=1 Tax=Nocardia yunnanensis TaxID=2382165 RepID=A0A386ZKX4_9NOCA|nr:diadenosine tetraphosphate hydrolase [Nocardia yunnanensis]